MLIESVYTLLANDTRLQAQLGPRADSGIYYMLAPTQVKFPYIVLAQTGGKGTTSFDGNNRLQEENWQLACYAASGLTAKRIAASVKRILSGLYGVYPGGSPVVLIQVQGAWLDAQRDFFPDELHGTEFSSNVDYTFHFVDAA